MAVGIKLSFVTLLALLLCMPASFLFAQTSCGDIITYEDENDLSSEEIITPIADCDDPFDETTTETTPYTLKIDGITIHEGDTIEVARGGTTDFEITGRPLLSDVFHRFFLHEGDDYRFANHTWPSSPIDADYQYFGEELGLSQSDIDLYIDFINGEQDYSEFDEAVQQAYFDFSDYIDEHFVPQLPKLHAGTYTLVSTENLLVQTNQSLFQKLFAYIVPTAFAQTFPQYRFTLTFTVTEVEPEPLGASSVLFLPGIQASLLYKESVQGTENKIWEPDIFLSQDVTQLAMTSGGESVNDVYTKGIMQSVPFGGTVYATFSRFMLDLVQTGVIEGWTPFAYDWRYSVTDVAENGTHYEEGIRDAIAEIERLATESYSGKVTIVGHSNGGLLAKAIMIRLEEEGKEDLVEKIILLASPQLGTPKAIGTVLHGYDQEQVGGWLIDDAVARTIINNMPGVYGLLPSSKYFEGTTEPIVSFSADAITSPYRAVYGNTISDFSEYRTFMNGNDGLGRVLGEETSLPAQANNPLFNDALTMHSTSLDTWTAPEGVEVIEIVGTGLPTMKAVEYRGVIENECVVTVPIPVFCTPEQRLKPYAVLTHYGDGTVVQHSAEAYEGEKQKYFVDLQEIKKAFLTSKFAHHNITEVQPVQDLLATLIQGTTTETNQFVSISPVSFDDEYDVEIIDSPVRLLATDTLGNQTGVVLEDGVRVVKEDIPGSVYFEFGDTKYFVVPKGTNRTTKLYGEAYGGYTLTTATLGGEDAQTVETMLVNATTTPTLVAEYTNTNSEFGTIVTDVEGDGVVDYTTTLDGELVPEEVPVTYSVLLKTVEGLTVPKPQKQALLFVIKSAEYYALKTPTKSLYLKLEDKLLIATQELIKLYEKKKYLGATDARMLQEMVQVLKDKQ